MLVRTGVAVLGQGVDAALAGVVGGDGVDVFHELRDARDVGNVPERRRHARADDTAVNGVGGVGRVAVLGEEQRVVVGERQVAPRLVLGAVNVRSERRSACTAAASEKTRILHVPLRLPVAIATLPSGATANTSPLNDSLRLYTRRRQVGAQNKPTPDPHAHETERRHFECAIGRSFLRAALFARRGNAENGPSQQHGSAGSEWRRRRKARRRKGRASANGARARAVPCREDESDK